MQNTSALYKEILAAPHWTETKAIISGVEYGQRDIVSAATSGGMYTEPGIGNCLSRAIDIAVIPKSTIPRQAKIQIFVRLCTSKQQSEWIPKGVFFISKRKKDKSTGILSITGYDSMLKGEETWLTPDYDTENWPMPQADAVSDIAQRMGVLIDERTSLSSLYPVAYPIDENGDLTMREVLGYIAVANSGNWIMTDEGKLRLIIYGDIPKEINYLATGTGDAITFGGVRIIV